PPGVVWSQTYPLWADFTSDGIVDQLSSNGADEVAVKPGRGDGTFGDPILSYAPYAGGLAVADFDGDGRLDVATAAQVLGPPTVCRGSGLLGAGDGTFPWLQTYELDYIMFPLGIGTGDILGDGLTDVVVGGYDDQQSYLFAVLSNDGIWPNIPQLRI